MQAKNTLLCCRVLSCAVVLSSTILTSVSALAWEDADNAFEEVYVLGGVTYTRVDETQFGQDSHNYNGEVFNNRMELSSDGNIGWRAGIGTWITEYLALEFNYFGVADINSDDIFVSLHDFSTPPESYEVDGHMHTTDMSFFDLSGVGRLDLDENFWTFLRVGVAYATVNREMSGTLTEITTGGPTVPFTSQEEDGGFGVAIGIGGQYDFNSLIGLRVEANTVQAENNNNMYAIGANIVFSFGGESEES